jgi:alkylhydroperoxidase family enzyme
MSWIRTVPPEEADGLLGRIFADAMKRAGRIYHIVRAMSLWPRVLRASMGLYGELMSGPAPLSKRRREMIAVVVSKANGCHY